MIETEVPPPLVGMVLADTYQIIRRLAVGGMGELYEATHLRLSGRCAIKLLLPQFAAYPGVLERFKREAEITSELRHPNIVSVLDFNTAPDGRAFLVMELLEGHDLGAELAPGRTIAVTRVREIAEQVVAALSAAHARGVVHRDLKPSNLFLSILPGNGREIVKVLDFGISKVREARTKLTREQTIIGTPQYMAPEQALGNSAAIDERTDQFALASILWELLAGRETFQADDVNAVLYQVVHEDPPALGRFRDDVPPRLERVLLRALAKAPAARFEDIDAFGEALAAAASGAPGSDRSLAAAPTLRNSIVQRAAPGSRLESLPRSHTTFGASSAELHRTGHVPYPRRAQTIWVVAAAAVGLTAAGAAAWLSARRNPSAAATLAPAPVAAAAAPAAPPVPSRPAVTAPPIVTAPPAAPTAPAAAPVVPTTIVPRAPAVIPAVGSMDVEAGRDRDHVRGHNRDEDPGVPSPPVRAPAPRERPSLIDGVDEVPPPPPAPPSEKPRVPLIDDI